jgi:phosphomannomutase
MSDFYFEELKALSYHRYNYEYNMLITNLFNLIYEIIFREDNATSKIKFTYTPMHGVGTPVAKRAFEVFSLNSFIPTKEQENPDPDFPTVAFPNPEEGKGLDSFTLLLLLLFILFINNNLSI